MKKISGFGAAMFGFAGLAGATSVGLAAFAAHGLAKMTPVGEKAVALFGQATDFQMTHTLALIMATLLAERVGAGWAQKVLRLSAILMALGALLFPTALYSASFGGAQFWAPWGGQAAMVGWLAFGIGALMTLRGESSGASDHVRALQPHAAE
jgi:uncharacterized membrane protein YgdD (TMEM256/DUF423 family)